MLPAIKLHVLLNSMWYVHFYTITDAPARLVVQAGRCFEYFEIQAGRD